MPTSIERSRAHLALNELWKSSERDQALAELYSRFAGHEKLPLLLLAVDVIDNDAACGGGTIGQSSIQRSLACDAETAALVLQAAGAIELKVREWRIGTGDYNIKLKPEMIIQHVEDALSR